MTTHYHSDSRGPVEIASMNYNHLLNARDKLARSDTHGLRKAEVDAMTARLAEIDAMAGEPGE